MCYKDNIYSFINLAVCLATDPKPLSKPALHIVRSRASSFRREYPLLSLRSFSDFLRLLHRLPVTFIPPFIFPPITCRRRQFLRIYLLRQVIEGNIKYIVELVKFVKFYNFNHKIVGRILCILPHIKSICCPYLTTNARRRGGKFADTISNSLSKLYVKP
jgi:hypothetical protein